MLQRKPATRTTGTVAQRTTDRSASGSFLSKDYVSMGPLERYPGWAQGTHLQPKADSRADTEYAEGVQMLGDTPKPGWEKLGRKLVQVVLAVAERTSRRYW